MLATIVLSVLIASGLYNTYYGVIHQTPSIQYALASNLRIANDRDNGSSGDDNNDSSPSGGDGEEGEGENNDPSDTLVARERENGDDADDEDPADVNEREDEQEEDPADVAEREEIQRPESIPSDGKDISLDIEEIDEEEIADQQITCLRYYHQNETTEENPGQDTGTLIVKRISADTGQVIPGGLFRITPNPYGSDSSLIISDKESTEKFDCSAVGDGMIVLEDVPFSPYNIQEIRHQPDFSSSDFFVVHESDIYVHENLASPVINFVERDFSFTKAIATDNNRLKIIPDQYIISLNENAKDAEFVAQEFVDKGAEVLHIYEGSTEFRGFAIKLNKNRELLNEIANDSRINNIEQDKMGQLASVASNDIKYTNKEYETIPKGIDRIDADLNDVFTAVNVTQEGVNDLDVDSNDDRSYGIINGDISDNQRNPQSVDVDIAILDTGISSTHPDLNVYQGASFVNGVEIADDDHGHGSHIAGTAAGKDNSLGVIGTAPGARLWAVKVCDRLGNCPVSSQIKGVEYVTEHSGKIDVVNISIENPLSLALDRMINQSIANGVIYVAAAGNSGKDASLYSPASNPSVITVSAIADSDGKCGGLGRPTFVGPDDSFANFSNFGDAIDIAAPGVDILSAYNGTEFGVDSGTSTAAPHVSGAAALYKVTHPLALPLEVYNALMTTASLSSTKCDGNGQGYFQGDIDDFEEPLLYVGHN